jgi:methyl-accepting chemotaxis protein
MRRESEPDESSRSVVPAVVRENYSAKLVVGFLVVTLLVAGIGANTYLSTSTEVRQSTEDDLTRKAQLQAETLGQWVGSMRQEAVMLSSRTELRADDPESVSPALRAELDSGRISGEVAALHLLAPVDGTLTVTSSTAEQFVGLQPREQGVPWIGALRFDSPDGTIVSQPFENPAGAWVFAVVSPVPETDRYLVMMVSLRDRSSALTRPDADGFTKVVNTKGQTVLSNRLDEIGTQNMDPSGEQAVESPAVERGLDGETGSVVMEMNGTKTAMGFAPVPNTDWVVMTHVPAEQAFALQRTISRDLLLLIGTLLVGLIVVGGVVGRRTVGPLTDLSEKAAALERGELDIEIESDRADEIGDLYDGFASMRDALQHRIDEAEAASAEAREERERAERRARLLRERVSDACEAMQAAADGDLTARIDADTELDAMDELIAEFNEVMASMESTVGDVQAFADRVVTASEDVSVGADEIETASREVATSVEQISAAATEQREQLATVSDEMGELSATVEEVASSADEVADTAREAREEGEDGRAAAEAAVSEMSEIVETADRTIEEVESLDQEMDQIGETVELIRNIAEQTNLLALNASIEAARAGRDGDGFAVVADEVKNLAEEASDATDEVEASITDVQTATADAVTDIREMGDRIETGARTVEQTAQTLQAIVDRVEAATDGITEISHVTDEQAATTEEVVSVAEDVARTSRDTADEAGEVSAAAEEQTASLEQVTGNVRSLSEQARELQSVLDQFETDDRSSASDPESPQRPVGPDGDDRQ